MNIGQQIKKLRHQCDMTQEQLAELLNISTPAISQWECDKTTPDISLIIPLARIFGVSTDVLFGVYEDKENGEIDTIIKNLHNSVDDRKLTKKEIFDSLQESLRAYPNNMTLLMQSLSHGIQLANPQSHLYDPTQGSTIYHECTRQANLVIEYSKDITQVMDAHMKMVTLHSANGNTEAAWQHARKLPWHCDLTEHTASAEIASYTGDFTNEAYHCQQAIEFFYDAVLQSFTRLGNAYLNMKKHDDALRIYNLVFKLIEIISVNESIMPPLHWTNQGDVYALMAKTHLAMGNNEKTLDWLEKMVEYDLSASTNFATYTRSQKAYLLDTHYPFYHWLDDSDVILAKLNASEFEPLKEYARFTALQNRASKNQRAIVIETMN